MVVLHTSHTSPSKPDDLAYLRQWEYEGILLVSPQGSNDDWYWLHAAMASGPECLAISNDEMRDHHFGLVMASAAFLKWKVSVLRGVCL